MNTHQEMARAGLLSWFDDDLWSVRLDGKMLESFIRPYIGNGVLGVQVPELVLFSGDELPILSVFKALYDEGEQAYLPEWSRFRLWVADQPYTLENGQHSVEHRLDFRTGEVTLRDRWEHHDGGFAKISATLLIPRHRHSAGLIRFEVKADAPVRLAFGLNAEHVKEQISANYALDGDNLLVGRYQTRKENREVCQGLMWILAGQGRAERHGGHLTIQSADGAIGLDLFHAVCSSSEGVAPDAKVREELRSLSQAGWDETRQQNGAAWKTFWERAVFPPTKERAKIQTYLAQQFYLLASLSAEPLPLGPLGVSRIGWRGLVFWDADLWVFRAILPVWPELAQAQLEFRFAGLSEARRYAQRTGFSGARYGWSTDDQGRERARTHYLEEIHINIWIAMSFWEYYLETKDLGFLREKAEPILSGIADFFSSRAVLEADGCFHIRGVVGPDEAVAEFGAGSCDDHYLTNLGARFVMQWARQAALLLNKSASDVWAKVEAAIYLPSPMQEGVIPEFSGYAGEGIKQADVILAFYLLDTNASSSQMRCNLEYYHNKIMEYGPFMNAQVEAGLRMREANRDEELDRLLQIAHEYSRGPHHLVFECRDPKNVNSVFLTAIGGLLHTLVYGYYGYRLGKGSKLPRLRDAWDHEEQSLSGKQRPS